MVNSGCNYHYEDQTKVQLVIAGERRERGNLTRQNVSRRGCFVVSLLLMKYNQATLRQCLGIIDLRLLFLYIFDKGRK